MKYLKIIYTNLNAVPLNDQQQFRLNKINKIKDCFVAKIKERELTSERLSKYIASFDYFYRSLINLSVTTVTISTALFAAVIRARGGMVSVLYLVLYFRFVQES